MIKNNFVALDISDDFEYLSPPFNPPKKFKEFQLTSIIKDIDKDNNIYIKVRNVLENLGLDNKNVGTDKWNPFCEFIKKGDNIVIKPNLVIDTHPLGKKGVLCTITHASIIRPIIDYILLATNCECKITICDVPLQTANWKNLINVSGLKHLVDYYRENGIKIQLLDLRKEISYKKDEIIVNRSYEVRDPLGYASVDLKRRSELMQIIKHYKKFEITDYGKGTVSIHHNLDKNEYCIPKTILDADVFINVPKIKTHRKAGLTCAMKNLIGINGDKRWIAHHRCGCKGTGGDEYPKLKLRTWFKNRIWAYLKRHRILLPFTKIFKKTYQCFVLHGKSLAESSMIDNKEISEGSWYGNDTLWRCIKDINKILLYSDKHGYMKSKKQRQYFCIVDGIISCEKEGPMLGQPKMTGIVIGGFNPVAIDKICADLMGFDYTKIPQILQGFNNKYWHLVDFKVDEIETNLKKTPNFKFNPSNGWTNLI